MAKLTHRAFHGAVHRQCDVDHTDLDHTLKHNRHYGGRFSPPGEFGAVYVALEPITAIRELVRYSELVGMPVDRMLPRTLLSLQLHVRQVLDLTDNAVCREWGLTSADMTNTSREVCWEIGRAAYRAGYEAIQFRSATGAGVCMAVFKDRLQPGSRLEMESSEIITTINAEDLDEKNSSR